jgi:glutamate-1-semialdehyde 2,1-aminomutase
MAAGIATLKCLQQSGFYENLESKSAALAKGLKESADKAGLAVTTNRVGSMLGLFFVDQTVSNFAEAQKSDGDRFARYYKGMLEQGVYLAPSQYEAAFVSNAHSEVDIEETIQAASKILNGLAK